MPYKKYILDKKQLNSNNFIKNTYCKIYFSFIVGHISSSDIIVVVLTPQQPQSGLSILGAITLSSSLLVSRVVMDQVFAQDLPAWLNMWELGAGDQVKAGVEATNWPITWQPVNWKIKTTLMTAEYN